MCIWDKSGLGFPRPPRTNILMLPLCNYCVFFAMRVNKMAADAYCVKNQTFLLVVIEHCKIAHFFRLEKLRNFTLYNFFSKTNISPHFGGFSSAIMLKHGNRHKTKTKAHTWMLEGSIPMFSWSENSFMKLFWSYFKSFSSYGFLGLQLRCSWYMRNMEIGIKQWQKHIHKCFKCSILNSCVYMVNREGYWVIFLNS